MITRRTALTAVGAGAAVIGAGAGAVAIATHDKPEPPAPPSTNTKGDVVWRNWSGIQHAYPQSRLAPANAAEVAQALKTAVAPVRVVGAGHSFTALAVTPGTMMSLDRMAGITEWQGDEAVVQAGIRLGALGPELAAKGRAMANLPDINKQSLGGALGTGTHGTGKALTAIHGDVTALTLATADGRLIDCDANTRPDIFNAARVSLGALGVITSVRLRTTPNRRLHRHVWVEPLEQALAEAEGRWTKHRNYEFYAIPFTDMAACISHDETDLPARVRGVEQDDGILEVLRGLRNLLGFSTPLRKAAAKAMLSGAKPEEAVDEGWKLLSTDRPVRFNEMEFHLPAENQLEALKEVVDTIERERPDIFFPIEARRIAPDDAWLSPFQGRASGSIAVHCYYKDEFAFLYQLIQPILLRHGGRPHWGKLHNLQGQELEALYPNWNDFKAVRQELDPEGRLLNLYLKGLFNV
jgi:FAD-linked oxidoreductase